MWALNAIAGLTVLYSTNSLYKAYRVWRERNQASSELLQRFENLDDNSHLRASFKFYNQY